MSRPITEAYQGSDTEGLLRGWLFAPGYGSRTAVATQVQGVTRDGGAREKLAVGKEQGDFAGRGLRPVTSVHEILGELDGEITADGSRRRLAGIRGTHQRAHDLPRIRALDHHGNERTA